MSSKLVTKLIVLLIIASLIYLPYTVHQHSLNKIGIVRITYTCINPNNLKNIVHFRDAPSIELLGCAWSHVSLSVYIVKPSWLSSEYISAVKKALNVWDRALEAFGNSYGYLYLSYFSFSTNIVTQYPSEYDILIYFTSQSTTYGGELGEAKIYYNTITKEIYKVEIKLYIYVSGTKMTPTDVFNTALHEIGHALGLGHASSSNTESGPEVMYQYYKLGTQELRPSTLDVYGLAVIYQWLKKGVFKAPSTTSVTLPSNIPYKMMFYYKIQVISKYGTIHGSGWYLENTKATIYVTSTIVNLSKGKRAVFIKWSGDITSTNPKVTITVTHDYTIYALWKIQYYVNITTPYSESLTPSGWYDKGVKIKVKLKNYLLTFSNKTKRIFLRWIGTINTTAKTIELTVNSPITLVAIWKTQYYITIISNFSKVLTKSGWYDYNSIVRLTLMNTTVYINNTMRYVFIGWNKTLPNGVEIRVIRPFTYIAFWRKQFYVRIISPYKCVNNTSGWYNSGSLLALCVNKNIIEHNNGTRHIFYGWKINKRNIYEKREILLRVTRPLTIRTLWYTEYLVKIILTDYEGHHFTNFLILLSYGNKIIKVNVPPNGTKLWLRRGFWQLSWINFTEKIILSTISKAFYNKTTVSFSLKENIILSIDKPKIYEIPLRISKINIYVKDSIGIPAFFMTVKLDRILTAVSDWNGYVATLRIPHGRYNIGIYFASFKIGEYTVSINKEGAIIIRVPISPYLVIIMLSLLGVIITLTRKKRV